MLRQRLCTMGSFDDGGSHGNLSLCVRPLTKSAVCNYPLNIKGYMSKRGRRLDIAGDNFFVAFFDNGLLESRRYGTVRPLQLPDNFIWMR